MTYDISKEHKLAVKTAQELRTAQDKLRAEIDAEIEENEDAIGSKETRHEVKVAQKAYDAAMHIFQNAVDDIMKVSKITNLREMYEQIGKVGLYR